MAIYEFYIQLFSSAGLQFCLLRFVLSNQNPMRGLMMLIQGVFCNRVTFLWVVHDRQHSRWTAIIRANQSVEGIQKLYLHSTARTTTLFITNYHTLLLLLCIKCIKLITNITIVVCRNNIFSEYIHQVQGLYTFVLSILCITLKLL